MNTTTAPRPEPAGIPVLDLFAGPGGWDEGARMAGLNLDITGIELDAAACATARAAGHRRIQTDVMGLNLGDWTHARGLIASPPCPTWSNAGKRSALNDLEAVFDTVTAIGWWEPDEYGEPAAWSPVTWGEVCAWLEVDDPRTGLFAMALWAALRLPNLEWVVMEQVPAAEGLFEDMAVEMNSLGWNADVVMIDAIDLGLPVRRRRVFLLAHRNAGRRDIDLAPQPARTMAETLGWAPGHRVLTRGNRRTSGGNGFTADGPSWALTGSTRSWVRDDGHRISIEEASLLHGFRADYPWAGSRSRQFLQCADVVLPPVAARLLSALVVPTPAGRLLVGA